MLTREQLLAADDRKTEDMQVDEWGGVVRIAVMSGAARDALQNTLLGNTSTSFFEASLLVATLVDDSGAAVFTSDDIAALQEKSTDVVARVASAAMVLNKLGNAGTAAALGNSKGAQSNDSGTA